MLKSIFTPRLAASKLSSSTRNTQVYAWCYHMRGELAATKM
jgi:hypothetical protein